MALISADRVRETSTTTGTGALTLAGAVTGFRAFSAVCSTNDTVFYVIAHQTQAEWECGLGTYSASNTLTRTTVHSSSNSNSAVSLSAGTKDVFISQTAQRMGSSTEKVFTVSDGSSVALNPNDGGIQVWTLGANRTPTASFEEGQSITLMVDDGTAYSITWTSISPTWIGGTAPTLATSGFTVIELWKRSSTIYGALVGYA